MLTVPLKPVKEGGVNLIFLNDSMNEEEHLQFI